MANLTLEEASASLGDAEGVWIGFSQAQGQYSAWPSTESDFDAIEREAQEAKARGVEVRLVFIPNATVVTV